MDLHGGEEGRERDKREGGWKGSEGGATLLPLPGWSDLISIVEDREGVQDSGRRLWSPVLERDS